MNGQPTKFLTLTIQRLPGVSAEQACDIMTKGWDRLLKWLRRRHEGAEVEAIWFIEATEAGYPHLHVLLRMPFTPFEEIKAHWYKYTGSYIAKIKEVRDPLRYGRYVAKYLSKAPAKFGRHKVYSRTRRYLIDWDDREPEAPVFGEPRWELLHDGLMYTKQRLVCSMYLPEIIDDRLTRFWKPWAAPSHVWKPCAWGGPCGEDGDPGSIIVPQIRIETPEAREAQACTG